MAHTSGCASTCVLQLKGVTVSPHSLQALMALGSQGWDLGFGIWGVLKRVDLWVTTAWCKSPWQSTAPIPVPPVTPILLQGGACRAQGSSMTARVGVLKTLWCFKTETLSWCLSFHWV